MTISYWPLCMKEIPVRHKFNSAWSCISLDHAMIRRISYSICLLLIRDQASVMVPSNAAKGLSKLITVLYVNAINFETYLNLSMKNCCL